MNNKGSIHQGIGPTRDNKKNAIFIGHYRGRPIQQPITMT